MYLPKVQLDAMLAKCGYDFFDGGFVSADYGVQKRSGNCSACFCKKTQTQAKRSLYWRQLAGGCCRFGASRHPQLAPSTQEVPQESLPAGAVAAFIANRLPGINPRPSALALPLSARWLQLTANGCMPGNSSTKMPKSTSGTGYVPDAPGLRAFVPAGADLLLAGLPPQPVPASLAQHRWDLLLAALPRQSLTGARSPPIAVPPARWTCKRKSYDLKHGPDTARPLLQALATPPKCRRRVRLPHPGKTCRQGTSLWTSAAAAANAVTGCGQYKIAWLSALL